MRRCVVLCAMALMHVNPVTAQDELPKVRFATFNVSMNREKPGQLLSDLSRDHAQGLQVAEIIQRVRPDVVLLNEFDYDPSGRTLSMFVTHYLGRSQGGLEPMHYAFHYSAPVNTGVPSGRDLDKDGKSDGPADAYGFGRFPGQYGMVVLSRYPFVLDKVRTFRNFLWKDMPNAALPTDPDSGAAWYTDDDLEHLRLSSKSHWDLPIHTERGIIHFLVSHPTPPAFDGPEDRNGCRNHDEIRFWADYIDPKTAGYIRDDKGKKGGLPRNVPFVIVGDLNADPRDGGGRSGAIARLLNHPRITDRRPFNPTGALQAKADGGANDSHKSDPRFDTSDFSDKTVGNLRVDYVLPSRDLSPGRAGIFWPAPGEPGSELVKCSDHRMVWIDIGSDPDE